MRYIVLFLYFLFSFSLLFSQEYVSFQKYDSVGLERLDLYNKLHYINLTLSNDNIERIDNLLKDCSDRIKTLYLQNIILDEHVLDFIVKSQPKEINLSFIKQINSISFFKTLSMLDSLYSLRIYNCDLSYIPEEIGEMSQLTRLEICYCPLRFLPNSLENLKNLQYLRINDTEINYIPKSFSLNNLIVLDISSNRFNGIPREVKQLLNMECFKFSNNIYFSDDDSILTINTKLNEVYLVQCGIEVFPKNLIALQNLEILVVIENKINGITYDFIKDFPKLKYLGLGLQSYILNKTEIDKIFNSDIDINVSIFDDSPLRYD